MEKFLLQLKNNPWLLTPIVLGTIICMLITIGAVQGFDKVDKYLMPLIVGLIMNLVPSPVSGGRINGSTKKAGPRRKRKRKL